jgi:hypothetical protein
MKPDCLPCWKGAYRRQETHIQRLRQIIVDAEAASTLVAHDDYWFGGNAWTCRRCGDPLGGSPGNWFSLVTQKEQCGAPLNYHEP